MRRTPIPRLMGLLLLLVPAGAAAAARPATGMAPGMGQAMAALQAGDYRRAVTLYDHVLSEFPGTVEARFQKGYALEKLGDPRGAIEEYEATLRLAPNEARALNNLGFLLVDRGLDVPRGMQLLRKAVKLSPDFAAAHDSLGWAQYRARNFGQAEDQFRAALRLDPNNRSAYYHVGVMALKRGDYERSALYFRKLVEREPHHVKGLIGLGSACERTGQREVAKQALTRALSLVGRDSDAGREILRMLNELGPYYPGASLERFLGQGTERTGALLDRTPSGHRPGAALAGGVGARSTSQGSGTIGPRLDFRKQAGDAAPQPGEAVAERPEKLEDDLLRRHLELGKLYEQNELYKDAESELLTVMNLEPASPEAREAKELLERVTGQPEVSQEARLGGYLRMGEALFARRADEEAKLQYEKVLLADATHPVANKALAFLYLRSGDLERALAFVNKALYREPRYLEALLIRGYIEARRRQFDRSCKTFEEVAHLAAKDTEVERYASDMAERMKRFSTLE